jgi:hypothetical protein
MWKTFALLLGGINLLWALPAPAEQSQAVRYPADSRIVQVKGELYHVKGDAKSDPAMPFEYWELLADGKTIYLVLRGEELLATAGQLQGQTVVATGVLATSSPSIRVTSLQADAYVNVEIRGRLGLRVRELHNWPDPELYQKVDIMARRCLDEWSVTADGKIYLLAFDDPALLRQAEKLNAKAVIVTGTPRDFALHVKSLKVDESDCLKEKVITEAKGQVKHMVGGNLWREAYVYWGLTINGQTYELDFGGLKDVADLAKDLDGKVVVLTGVLEIIPPRLSGLPELLPREQKAEISNAIDRARLRIPGKMVIHVSSLKLADARKPAEHRLFLSLC